jgi:hypothetical protein
MTVFDEDVLKMRDTVVELHETHLEGYEGKLFAKTVNGKMRTFEDVCVSAKERGGFTGNLDDLKAHTAVFLREAAYLIRDGCEVSFGGIVGIRLGVDGFVENEYPHVVDTEENKLSLHVRLLDGARKLVENIRVVSRGLAPVRYYIAKLIDTETGVKNRVITKDGIATMIGRRLKISGSKDETGVFFLPSDMSGPAVKLPTRLATNEPARLVFKAPELPPGKDCYVEVRTYYSGGGGRLLKNLRIIRSKFTVRQA